MFVCFFLIKSDLCYSYISQPYIFSRQIKKALVLSRTHISNFQIRSKHKRLFLSPNTNVSLSHTHTMEKAGATVMDPETAFLASKEETGNEWELYKENVRPLKRGRNVTLLNHALRSQSNNHLKKSLVDHRRSIQSFSF